LAEPTGVIASFFAAVLKLAPDWLPALLGAAVSLRWIDQTVSRFERFCIWLGGAVTAVYLGSGATEWLSLSQYPKTSALVIFVFGSCGLGLLHALRTETPSLVTALRKKFIGE
jgi:hypothetical protein